MHGHPHRHLRRHDPVRPGNELKRVADEVRVSFRLGAAVPLRVEELVTTERGFPPLETRIEFWTGNDRQHQYRIFKPAAQVTGADLPPWWMKDALIVDEFPHCDCCG